jgi:hypothetical protein
MFKKLKQDERLNACIFSSDDAASLKVTSAIRIGEK